MKNTLMIAGLICVLGGAVTHRVMAAGLEPRTVTTNGEAEVKVVPDEVVLTLGVETSDKDLSLAKAENDRRVKEVIAAAQAAGVSARDIQTDFFRIEPRYHNDYEKKDFIGYFVQKTVAVTLRDVAKFEKLLSAVLAAGANYVHGIDFRTTELRKHRDAARALAIRAAREKAEALAGALGQKVGRPTSIQEGSSGWWSSYGGWWGGRYGNSPGQNVMQVATGGGSDAEGPLAPGTISVQASVAVSFEME